MICSGDIDRSNDHHSLTIKACNNEKLNRIREWKGSLNVKYIECFLFYGQFVAWIIFLRNKKLKTETVMIYDQQ